MNLNITGDLRSVANSAWISTIDETKANDRSDEDVDRVTGFLAENLHTSPFECVTLTFTWGALGDQRHYMRPYIDSRFSRVDFVHGLTKLSIDLWNFVKITNTESVSPVFGSVSLREGPAWIVFSKREPLLAEKCEKLKLSGQKLNNSDDISAMLGDHSMSVELISLHNEGIRRHSRATWRVKCPLSIAVQVLRHRTGSFNMVSGRYRTIKQELIGKVNDVGGIFSKIYKDKFSKGCCATVIHDKYQQSALDSMDEYRSLMKDASNAYKSGVIQNSEYRRLREAARYILPEGRLTELYVTFYLDDFDRYLILRDSPDAQVEHRWVAREMSRTITSALNSDSY